MTPAGRRPARDSRPLPYGAQHVVTLARRHRGFVAYGCYALASVLALVTAYGLRFDFAITDRYQEAMGAQIAALIALRFGYARGFHLMSARWRYVSVDDLFRLAGASTLSSLFFLFLFRGVFPNPGVPLSVVGIEWALFNLGVGGSWLCYRKLAERIWVRGIERRVRAKRVLVVGAGEAGNLLAREMGRTAPDHKLVAFLDDDPLKKGTRIRDAAVIGGTAEIKDVVENLSVDEVIIAIPSAGPTALRRLLQQMEGLEVPFKVLPGIDRVIAGDVQLSQLRPLRIEDLLGRESVTLELPALANDLEGRTVLVTGAAGSIGSELCRQIAANSPARLILLDQAESDLYWVDLELRARHPGLTVHAVVGDILDEPLLEEVFDRYAPDQVYHAAAYKHVPLMEQNAREAVRNNVVGTWLVARMAGEQRLERFVLISTDKAANPVSAMGATKKAAEGVVQALQARYPETHFVAVRFGNVLGSNGSVVPLFQKQIANGGPITITHPEVSRFFMTIAEAVQLVLQAGLLREARGRITMLDMGEPVKIIDLARNLVRLSGLRPEVDIQFRYTGLRPGEKMHETLSGEGEKLEETNLSKVWIVTPPTADEGMFEVLLGVLCDHTLPPADWLKRLESLTVGSASRGHDELAPLRHRRREHAPA